MSLQKYIAENTRTSSAPVKGDLFDFHINESLSIQCEVADHSDNSYIVGVDMPTMYMLKKMNLISESMTCSECGSGYNESTTCNECGYSMNEDDDEDSDTLNYAVEYVVSGSDDDQTNILRIIAIKNPSVNGEMPYPEFIRKQIEQSPGNKEMLAKGHRPKKIKAAWTGSLDGSLAKASDPRTQEELQFAKRHSSGKPYKTKYGTEISVQNESVYDFDIFIKDPRSGKNLKMNTNESCLSIIKSTAVLRESFQAQYNCSNKSSARYWSCKIWNKNSVTDILESMFSKVNEDTEKLSPEASAAVANMSKWAGLDNSNPYHSFRFGVALAGSPDKSMPLDGPVGSSMVTVAYTDADKAILASTGKKFGFKSKPMTSGSSDEASYVNTKSPVPQNSGKKK